jgi:hypothetical protein
VTSALLEKPFQKERLEKKQKSISKKGSEDKADNVLQGFEGVKTHHSLTGRHSMVSFE